MLSPHRLEKGIYGDHTTYRRRFFAKKAKELVVPSARSDRLTGAVCIPFENDPGVIMIFAQKRQIKADVSGEAVRVNDIPHIDEPLYGSACAGVRSGLCRFLKVLRGLHEVPDPQKKVSVSPGVSFAL